LVARDPGARVRGAGPRPRAPPRLALEWRAMNAEAATYARELAWLLAEVCACLKDLTPSQLTWRPATGAANSAYAIAYHVGEVTRVYALGFGCGWRVTRDRSTEFSGTGTDAGELIA